jgi:hypothetical protein
MSFARVSDERERCESLDQAPLQRGRDDKKSFCPDKCKTIKTRILLVDLLKSKKGRNSTVSTVFCLSKKGTNSTVSTVIV